MLNTILLTVFYHNQKCPYERSKKLVMYIIRITADGELADSRPCIHCLKMMKNNMIKKVVYTTFGGEIKIENINDISTQHISCGFRHQNGTS